MDELRLLAADSTTHSGTPTAPPDASARWRSELERAQWALRAQRSAAASQAAAPRGEAAPQGERGRAQAMPAGSSRSASEARGAQTAKAESSGMPRHAAAAARDARGPAKASAGLALSNAMRESQARAAPPAAPAPAARPVPVVWPRIHVHAMLNGGMVDVWVRDASLDEKKRRALAGELRAQMQAAGRRLGTLTVNGEPISTEERTTPWQSKR